MVVFTSRFVQARGRSAQLQQLFWWVGEWQSSYCLFVSFLTAWLRPVRSKACPWSVNVRPSKFRFGLLLIRCWQPATIGRYFRLIAIGALQHLMTSCWFLFVFIFFEQAVRWHLIAMIHLHSELKCQAFLIESIFDRGCGIGIGAAWSCKNYGLASERTLHFWFFLWFLCAGKRRSVQ